ncbi:MAG: hypothetical protein LBT29_06720 [Flavobacteriaceae bacterium]|jgi:hypothetical protein|nr:hypothetical protein [Flavobacteriaceae bacterium]
MKKLYVFFVIGLPCFFFACKEGKSSSQNASVSDSLVIEEKKLYSTKTDEKIDLAPIQSDIPEFGNVSADAFVAKAKTYFEKMAEATQKGDNEQVLQLQLQAIDIDDEYQNAKKQLNAGQQKQLENWYMKLVEAAAK